MTLHPSQDLMPNPFALDQLPPPTKAQVLYWRELCRAVATKKGAGMSDGAWPPDIAPSALTLRDLHARHLLVRRGGAWHVRRNWEGMLTHLLARAVPTPPLALLDRPAPDLPSFGEMEAWEPVLLWLDAQPGRRARLPFPSFDEGVCHLLAAMRRWRLVRLVKPSCYWTLSPAWRPRFLALWRATVKDEGESPAPSAASPAPVSLVAGIDTWYLNRIDEEGLPTHLHTALDDWQAEAKAEDAEVETRWWFDGAPLCMYRSGVNAAQGGGISWAYILRNTSLTLRIRRKPLGGIIAQAQFGSECLWRLTPLTALTALDDLIHRMWGITHGAWCTSQVHLAHDVMGLSLDLDQLSEYVSRSRTGAIFDAARADLEAQYGPAVGDGALDWGEIYGADDTFFDPLLALGQPVDLVKEDAEDRAVTVYRWGRRLSGVAWSQGGDVSLVQYVKTLEIQRTGKRHMVPLWEAQGYTGTETVLRHEVRLRRGAFRELRVPGCPPDELDNPWRFLEHQADVFALVVGHPHPPPGMPDSAWIRRVQPTGDSNRSRWPTHPVCRIVQGASFTPSPPEVRQLMRVQQRDHDLARRVRVMYGALVSATALAAPQGEGWDVSKAIASVAPLLVDESEVAGKDFGELVRERKRRLAQPVQTWDKVLPDRPPEAQAIAEEGDLDAEPGEYFERAYWRVQLAERRMHEVLDQLAAAKARRASAGELAQLEEAYLHEVGVRDAALVVLESPPPVEQH